MRETSEPLQMTGPWLIKLRIEPTTSAIRIALRRIVGELAVRNSAFRLETDMAALPIDERQCSVEHVAHRTRRLAHWTEWP